MAKETFREHLVSKDLSQNTINSIINWATESEVFLGKNYVDVSMIYETFKVDKNALRSSKQASKHKKS